MKDDGECTLVPVPFSSVNRIAADSILVNDRFAGDPHAVTRERRKSLDGPLMAAASIDSSVLPSTTPSPALDLPLAPEHQEGSFEVPLDVVAEEDLDKTLAAAQTTRTIAEAEARVEAAYGLGMRAGMDGTGIQQGQSYRAEFSLPAKREQARLHACWIVPVTLVDELPLPGAPRPMRRPQRLLVPCTQTLPAPAFANFVTSTLADLPAAFVAPAMADPLAMLVAPASVDPLAILACMPGAAPGAMGAWEPRSIPVHNDENACPLPTAVLHGYCSTATTEFAAPNATETCAASLATPDVPAPPSEGAGRVREVLATIENDQAHTWDYEEARDALYLTERSEQCTEADPEASLLRETEVESLGTTDEFPTLDCLSEEAEATARACKRTRAWNDSSSWPVLSWQQGEAMQSEP